ncbi:MAG: SMP-30/gluconolactonase/LRE family protein [Gemmatimonadota bacterium]
MSTATALACGGGERTGRGADAEPSRATAGPLRTVSVLSDLPTPESATLAPDGRYYVSVMGEFGTAGDGRIVAVDPSSWSVAVVADGLDDPKGLAFVGETLYVADRTVLRAVAPNGATRVVVPAEGFPNPPQFLNDVAAGPAGELYVSDSGTFDSADGFVYRVDPDARVGVVLAAGTSPIASPNGVWLDADGRLWVVDLHTGELLRRAPDGTVRILASGFGGGDGIAPGPDGSLYVSDFRGGRVLRVTFDGDRATSEVVAQLPRAADIGVDAARGRLLVPQLQENTVTVLALP